MIKFIKVYKIIYYYIMFSIGSIVINFLIFYCSSLKSGQTIRKQIAQYFKKIN